MSRSPQASTIGRPTFTKDSDWQVREYMSVIGGLDGGPLYCDPQTKQECLEWAWISPRSGPSSEWRPCQLPSMQFPINGKVGNRVLCSHSCTPGALGLILMYFFYIYLVSSGFSFKPTLSSPKSSSSTQFSQVWVVNVQKGGRKTLNKLLKDMNKTKTFLFVDCPWHDVDNCHYFGRVSPYTCTCSLHSWRHECMPVRAIHA